MRIWGAILTGKLAFFDQVFEISFPIDPELEAQLEVSFSRTIIAVLGI